MSPEQRCTVLAERDWHARRAAHQRRVTPWTEAYRARRSRGDSHPVHDFLFRYYSYAPAHLRRWHPGAGVVLAGQSASQYLKRPGYVATADGVAVDLAAFTPTRRRTAQYVTSLLAATAARTPRLTCFGLHEWAMLYRTNSPRHERLPLRLGQAGTDAVVETLPIRCTHTDAYRFFTQAARPRNTITLTHDRQIDHEQPGCLHTNMDLYKWSSKLDPFVPSELIADCFELAVRIRELDMRASPYDLTELGYQPVPTETAAGRAEYARHQAEFAAAATPLRQALIDTCRDLLTRTA